MVGRVDERPRGEAPVLWAAGPIWEGMVSVVRRLPALLAALALLGLVVSAAAEAQPLIGSPGADRLDGQDRRRQARARERRQ